MAEFSTLVGDKLIAVRTVGRASTATHNLPWLEIETESGRKFELAPVADSLVNGVEQLQIELREVACFSTVPQWPGGPAVPKSDLVAMDCAISKLIASATLESNESTDCVLMRFWGGGVVRIRHDPARPMSLTLDAK